MATQLIPIIKAVGPYIAQIASAAIPAFTAKSDTTKMDPALERQIVELQSAVTANAESIQVLAEKVQETMRGIELATIEARREAQSFKALLFGSLVLSAISLSACIYMLMK